MANLNLRTFDLNLLKVFDAIMAERNLTRAAQQLSITQPAVSNALRRLREALGDELLLRQGRGLEPTARALALWPAVRDALQQLQASLSPHAFEPAQASNTFVLTMADATAAELIPPLETLISRDAPGLCLRLVPLTTRDPRRLLADGQADLALGHFPVVIADLTARTQTGEPVDFKYQRLFSGDYVCAMRRGHPLARSKLTLDKYCAARHMLVSFSGRPFGFVDEALASLGRERRLSLTVNQYFTAGKAIAKTDLLTVLPRHFVKVMDLHDAVVVRELPFPVTPVQINALWHSRQDASAAHAWLRGQIVNLARQAFGP